MYCRWESKDSYILYGKQNLGAMGHGLVCPDDLGIEHNWLPEETQPIRAHFSVSWMLIGSVCSCNITGKPPAAFSIPHCSLCFYKFIQDITPHLHLCCAVLFCNIQHSTVSTLHNFIYGGGGGLECNACDSWRIIVMIFTESLTLPSIIERWMDDNENGETEECWLIVCLLRPMWLFLHKHLADYRWL